MSSVISVIVAGSIDIKSAGLDASNNELDVCSKICREIKSKSIPSSESVELVNNFMLAAKLMPPKSSSIYKSSIDWICCK